MSGKPVSCLNWDAASKGDVVPACRGQVIAEANLQFERLRKGYYPCIAGGVRIAALTFMPMCAAVLTYSPPRECSKGRAFS